MSTVTVTTLSGETSVVTINQGQQGPAGAGLSIVNPGDNRVLTNDGSATGVVSESNLTFDGSILAISGTPVSISGHSHTSSDISDFNEAVDDRIGGASGLFVAGTGINLSYNDESNQFTINSSGLILNEDQWSDFGNPLRQIVGYTGDGTTVLYGDTLLAIDQAGAYYIRAGAYLDPIHTGPAIIMVMDTGIPMSYGSYGIRFRDNTSQTTAFTGIYNIFDQSLNTTDGVTHENLAASQYVRIGPTYEEDALLQQNGPNTLSIAFYTTPPGAYSPAITFTPNGITFPDNSTQNTAALPLNHNNYVICKNGDSLAAKYAAAKLLTPGGNPLSATNRATLIVMPGTYSLSGELQIDTEYVDILGLGSNKLHRGCKTAVTITNNTISVLSGVNDIKIKGISVGSQAFKLAAYNQGYYEDCIGGHNSFGYTNTIDATFVNCVGDNDSFGYLALGDYINCIGGNNSFGLLTAFGSFINCEAVDNSFGGGSGTANGIFIDCVGGSSCFGGYSDGISTGTFTNCRGNMGCFGSGGAGGVTGGFYTNCVGGLDSFGNGATISGTLISCRLTAGIFDPLLLSGSGKFRLCINDNYDIVNADAP